MKIAEMKVTYLDHMGDDISVVNAARVSFDKESDWEEWNAETGLPELSNKDTKLIAYLAKHNHWSPFSHTSISLRIKAPIFVARQLVKHQVGLAWNEVSRRYVDSEVEIYMPSFWRSRAENVKQGSSNKEVKINTYGNGICVQCGKDVPRKSVGPRGKWCSEACRASHRKEHDPDFRLHTAKYNAQSRGMEFSLNRGDVVWPTHCPLLGIELVYSSFNTSNDNSPSLDRIDSSKGYIPGNVWVISNKANRMKNDGSKEELVKFAKSILLHFNGQVVPETGSVESVCQHMVEYYYHLLDEGVAPEQARMVLPQNTMTEWIWTGSLYAFARVCNLRLDAHSQSETQEVAKMISDIIQPLFPVSWGVLVNQN